MPVVPVVPVLPVACLDELAFVAALNVIVPA